MEINVEILTKPVEPTDYKMVCVSKKKYSDVELCLQIPGCGNIVFASLAMGNGTYSDKKQQFEALEVFGEQIAEAWNEKRGKAHNA